MSQEITDPKAGTSVGAGARGWVSRRPVVRCWFHFGGLSPHRRFGSAPMSYPVDILGGVSTTYQKGPT